MKKVYTPKNPALDFIKLLQKEIKELKTGRKALLDKIKRLEKELEFYRSDTMRNLTRQNETLESELEKLTKQGAFLGINEFEGNR